MTDDDLIARIRAERSSLTEGELVDFDALEICPDFSEVWAFVDRGEDAELAIGDGTHWGGKPPLPDELVGRLVAWQAKFARAPFDDDLFLVMDWESFHAEGLALATEVKQELGDAYTVRYAKAFEDRNRTVPFKMEIAGR